MQDYVIQPIYCEINDLTFQIEELNIVVVCSVLKEKGIDFVKRNFKHGFRRKFTFHDFENVFLGGHIS